MSKELSPLEALKRLKHKLSSTKANGYWEELDIIETALKRIPELVRESNKLFDENKTNEKKLKALEIIKVKMVDTSLLMQVFTNEEHIPEPLFYYNNHVDNYRPHKHLTQAEYELLKEVLL